MWKVIKNKKVIDVLDRIVYVRYQIKNNALLLCDISEAEGILSSDGNHAYHTISLRKFPVDIFDSVDIEEIDIYEYKRLKVLHVKTPEEIIDDYTRELIGRDIL